MPTRLENLDREVRRLWARVNKLIRLQDQINLGQSGQMLRKGQGTDLEWIDPQGEKDLEYFWPADNSGETEVNLLFGEYGDVKLFGATVLITDTDTGDSGSYEFTFGYSDGTYKPLELFSSGQDSVADVFEFTPYEDENNQIAVRITLASDSMNAALLYRQSFAV